MMWGWVGGSWLIGAAFMVFMMVLMVWMMSRGHSGHAGHGRSEDPERTLADRLARGEIDAEEYTRLLEALRDAYGSGADKEPSHE